MSQVKNNVLNRALAMLLSIMMIVAMLPTSAVSVLAASDTHPGVFTITVKDGGSSVNGATVILYDEFDNRWTETTDNQGVAAFDEFTQKGKADEISGQVSYTVSADTYESKDGTVENAEADDWAGNVDVALSKAVVVQKKVTVNVTGSGTAMVKLNGTEQEEISVNQGSEVTMEILPEKGAYIKSLSVADVGKTIIDDQKYFETLTVSDDISVSVVVNKRHTVFINKNEGGTVTLNGGEESVQVDEGSDVKLDVQASEGYQISSVKIGTDSRTESLTDNTSFTKSFSVEEDKVVEVRFIKVYTVEVEYSGNGKVEINGNSVTSGGLVTVKEGEGEDKITVKAQPSEGYRVSSVLIDGTPVDKVTGANDSSFQKELDKTKDYSIVITFALNVYTVSAQKAENGSVNVEEPSEVVHNGSKTVFIVPDDGFTVEKVTVNSTEIKDLTNDDKGIHFEINNITANQNIVVTFKEKAKALASDVSIDSSSALRKNEDQTLLILKKGESVEFSTEKDGLRLYDNEGEFVAGSESEQSVSVSKSVIVKRIQVYYKVEGELYADWHDVETKKIEIVVDETNPTATLEPIPAANALGYHKSDVVLKVSAEDPDRFSGIQKIEYYIKVGNSQEETKILYEYKKDGDIQNQFSQDDAIKIEAETHNRDDILVNLTVTDLAGNTFTATQDLKINSIQPTVTLVLDGTKNVGADKDVFNGKRKLTIIVTDREDTFDRSAVAKGLKITRDGQPVTVNTEEISWSENGSPYIGTYTFQDDGVYNWSLSYTNKADFDAKISLTSENDGTFYNFKIDTEAPHDLKVTYEPTFKDVVLSTLTFGFYNPSVKVKIEAKDETAGIEKFEYSYAVQAGASTINEGKENVVVDSSSDDIKLSDDGVASVTFEIPAQFRGQVSFTATDKGGNTSELHTDGRIIVVDTIAPGVTVSYNDDGEAVNEKYYSADRTATIEIDEANFFGTAEYGQADFNDVISGKENTYLEITVGKTTNDGTHTDTKQYPEFTKKPDGKYTATILFDEDADYTLTIQYTDRSGNEAVIGEYQKEFTVDKTTPTIEVSFDNNTALNEKYFGADRKATITVTEHNFDASTVTAGIVCSDSPMNDFDTYLQNDLNWNHDGDVHTAEIKFTVDGHYTFKPACSDKAGNPNASVNYGESVAGEQFVLDKVAPKQDSLQIFYSKSVLDTVLETISFGFYKAPVTVTIEAEDETSGIDYFTYTYAVSDGVSAKNHGKAGEVIAHSEITPSGNSASATFQIPAQFRGTVSFVATDMAGNSEDKADDKVVVVDDIAPGITVSYDNNDARNEKYYDDDRIATITIDEANFFGDAEWDAKDLYDLIPETDKEYLAISVTKRLLNSSESTTTKMYPEFTKEGDIYTATIEFNENAEYKFEIEYTDRSGNIGTVAEYQKEFVINKEPPKLSISYDNMTALNGTYYKADRIATIQIAESTFRASEVEFTISATDVTGKTSVDLSSKAYETYLKDQSHWAKSEDNVWTAQITLDIEGNYDLNLKYVNLAGTPQDKEITDSFCIDKSDPDNLKISYEPNFVGVLLETLTFGFYKAPVKVTLEATDDYAGVDYFVYSYKVQENASEKNVGKIDVRTVESQLTREGNKASTTFEIPAQFRGFVSFDVFDKSGNKNSLADENVVVVDNIAPGINVTYDNNSAFYEKYYSDDRVATITIDEANFFEDDLTKDNLLVITVDKTTDAGVHITENVKPTFSKNGDVYTGTVEFRENADYKFTIAYTDRSGNAAVIKEYQTEFTIDKIAPTIKVTYDNNKCKNGDQFKEDRTATIEITEHNFKPSDVVAKVTASGTEVTEYASYLKNADSWTTVGDVHTAEIKYTDEAHYEFSISYSDMAGVGNTPVYYDTHDAVAPEKFTLDKSAPTRLEITIDSKSVLGSNSIAFDTFYDKAVSVKLAANCDISGLESLKYQKVSSVPEYDVNGQWNDYNTETGIVVAPSEKFIIYFRAEDRAGNYTIVNSTGIVVDDKMPEGTDEKNAPEIDISPDVPNANGFHNGNVNVDLHVIDPKYTGQSASATGHYSGLNKITYRIYTTDMGADVQETGTLLELGSKTDGAVFDDARLVSSWSGRIPIDATVFNSNNTIVEITAVDNAGNTRVTTTKAGDIQIDVTAPKIDVSYNNNAADSNSFFKADRTATVVVTERNFDPKDIKVTITNTDGIIPLLSEWRQISAGTGNRDNATWAATITYSADGDYTFDITYTDLATNLMSGVSYRDSVAPTEFTIDKTLPIISVSYNNNAAANGKYFKAPRTATVTINEHNFDVNRVTFTRTAALDGATIALPNISWGHNGNVHTATIPYTADGDYTFDVTMLDLAGNQSTAANYGNSAASKDFTVDQTIVKPTITGVEDGHAYKDDVIPNISFSDVNYDSYEVKLMRTRKDEIGVDVTSQFIDAIGVDAKGGSKGFDTFKREVGNDGIYTLTVRMLDKAGNEETQSLTFTVNRFGSVYEYDSYLISLIQDGGSYVGSITDDLIITEYNANRLVNDSLNIEITLDGRSIDAKYVADPVPNANVNVGQSGWFQYQYTISKDNFNADGMYHIALSSEDEAANTPESNPDNSTDENGNAIVDTMQFRVDSTAPEITSIVGLESKIINEQKVDVRYTVYDAIGLKSITVYLDGKAQDPITAFDDVNNYSGTFTMSESSSAQKVRILVEDKAGNTVDTDDFGKEDADGNVIVPMPAYSFNNTVTVSTNFFVRWYANKPLFWGSIGGVVGLAAVIWILIVLLKKKRKNNEEK